MFQCICVSVCLLAWLVVCGLLCGDGGGAVGKSNCHGEFCLLGLGELPDIEMSESLL